MAFNYEIINKFSQFGVTYFDVIVKDDEHVHPDYRVTKKLDGSATEDDFIALAEAETAAYEELVNTPIPEPILPPSYMLSFVEFIKAINSDLLAEEFPTFVEFLQNNNPGVLEKDFDRILIYLDTKYPGIVAAFKSQGEIE